MRWKQSYPQQSLVRGSKEKVHSSVLLPLMCQSSELMPGVAIRCPSGRFEESASLRQDTQTIKKHPFQGRI